MKSITILKKDATILHDGIVAHTPDGKPVFILPANLPTPQLDVHPDGMIVYSLPEQQFPPFIKTHGINTHPGARGHFSDAKRR